MVYRICTFHSDARVHLHCYHNPNDLKGICAASSV